MPVNPIDVAVPKHKEQGERGQRRGRGLPKGRQLNVEIASALVELLQVELGDRSVEVPGRAPGLDPAMLIEYLHAVHDHYRHLSGDHFVALAHLLGISSSEVYEVATFYAHFRIAEQPPAKPVVRVCDSVACALGGQSAKLQAELAARGDVLVEAVPCIGRCHMAPAVSVDHVALGGDDVGAIAEICSATHAKPVTKQLLAEVMPASTIPTVRFQEYVEQGGYGKLQALMRGEFSAEDVLDALDKSGLRGLGGAGFPTARKWRMVRGYAGPRMIAVNADEGEPGTFKDHYCFLTQPHQVLEAMLIAALVMETDTVFLYLRDEYADLRVLLDQEIAAIEANTLFASPAKIVVRRGAGAYICGEESAMLESIEGKRGLPRHKPPYPAEVGLFNLPTLINNVETLFFVTEILYRGADWFAQAEHNGRRGYRHYSVSGQVREPGVKLALAGTTLQELIDEHCGGMLPGHELKAFLPGGASGGIFPAVHADVPLDFDMFQPLGGFIGSAAVVVFSQHDSMLDVSENLMRFFRHESCGQCTPCRTGTEKMTRLLSAARSSDGDQLADKTQYLAQIMTDASICGLGQAAANPVLLAMKHFPQDMGLLGRE